MKDFENILEKYFLKKAPKMPEDLQNLIVQYGPYVLLVFVVIAGINFISLLSFNNAVFNPMRAFAGSRLGGWYQFYLVFTAVILVLEALAIPGLMKKEMKGWRFMLYATIVGLVQGIVTFNIASIIIGAGLGFYILYQIKHHYK